MNDSQDPDYLDILNSLLASRREWDQVPEIVNLAFKAVARMLQDYNENFVEHKTLINQQSLKLKELQLVIKQKVDRKDLQAEVMAILNSNSNIREEDSVSQYEKLIKQSHYDKQRNAPPTIEQLKTIADIIAQKHTDQTKKDVKNQLLSQKLQIEQRISTLKEEMKSRMVEIEREKRQLANQCRQAHSRYEESRMRYSNVHTDEKINLLELSSKRVTEGLSHLVNHLQQNFLTKQEINLLMEREKQKRSPIKQKNKEYEKNKQKEEYLDISKEIQRVFNKYKNQQRREWAQFKQNVTKEIGKMVNSQTINNLIDSFQKDTLQKHQSLTALVNRIDAKVNTLSKAAQGNTRQILTKSQKRPEKRSSPSKSIEVIQSSLNRLQKTILQKQSSQLRRLQKQVEGKIGSYDLRLIKQLDRRQRHLCQVIQETYNQNLKISRQDEGGDFKVALKKLYDTNLICRYLYIGTKQCKKDSCIPWQKEALNNIVENFIWKKESTAILINAPGLYRIDVGLFGDIDTETILLLNGDPFGAIPMPAKSRSTGVKVRGATFSQAVLLPPKSKLSVRVGQHFYGQAFLQLRQM